MAIQAPANNNGNNTNTNTTTTTTTTTNNNKNNNEHGKYCKYICCEICVAVNIPIFSGL
jgi:hypothetical protein